MTRADKPLALTLGDPAGIGPDITLLAFEERFRTPIPPFVLLGDPDVLAERARALRLGVKIKTIGDNYMAVSGVPTPRPNHARMAAKFALDTIAATGRLRSRLPAPFPIRVGLHSGPVMAGVIGTRKFAHDDHAVLFRPCCLGATLFPSRKRSDPRLIRSRCRPMSRLLATRH